jgi:single-stranded-DNA-specific exonuclease
MEKRWEERGLNPDLFSELAAWPGGTPLLKQIIARRSGIGDFGIERFINPRLKDLREPYLFADMEKAVLRIAQAIGVFETIGIFGDYDVDGVCSTAILGETLKDLGARVVQTLPNRMSEGYGLSRPGIDRLHQAGVKLLIAADCGILAFQAIDYANSLGMQVVVVDHHKASETLPAAYAIINPQRHDCGSGATFLCAAGVSFFLCMALVRHFRQAGYFAKRPEPDIRKSLDLVALATVCDVVPLIKDNRIMVAAGLNLIRTRARPGIKALIEVARVDPHKISSTNLGFHLGPRINAAGRLEDAEAALDLLQTSEAATATALSCSLNEQNEERKALELATVEAVIKMVDSDEQLREAPVIVVHDEEWHPGVVGIVASRIAEKYHRPSIIIGTKGKGSGRSIKGIDLHEMVSLASSLLAGFGGHAHAIGVTLGEVGVVPFRELLWQQMQGLVDQRVYTPVLFYDAVINTHDVSFDLIRDMARLEPFGTSNPGPIFRFNGCNLRNVRELAGGHLKGQLEGERGAVDFIAFRMALNPEWALGNIDVLAAVEENVWQGRKSLQLRLIDIKKASG